MFRLTRPSHIREMWSPYDWDWLFWVGPTRLTCPYGPRSSSRSRPTLAKRTVQFSTLWPVWSLAANLLYCSSATRLDHRQNRSRVYRVWRVADWAVNVSHDEFRYDVPSGSVHILTPGLYLIYSRVSIHTGWSDVTESMATIRSPFCGYNMA